MNWCVLPLVIGLVVLTAACGQSNPTSSTLPTTVAAPTVTEVFNGTLPSQGFLFYTFTAAATGTVNATLTSAGPPATITLGLGLGTPASGTCALVPSVTTTTQAGTSPQLSAAASAGPLCLAVYDVGNVLQTTSFSVTIAHP